ncbi:MAG: hypothetical protein ACYSWU_24260, partial [Planctomycetota bacterium]
MVDMIQIAAIALGLTVLGVGVLRYRRRAAGCPRRHSLAGSVASLAACACLLAAGGLLAYAWLLLPAGGAGGVADAVPPPEPGSKVAPSASTKTPDPDERFRRLVVGTWTDNYKGKRTMTLDEDGTGTMVVELTGLTATLFADRLQFDMVWSVENGRMKKRTIGGEPAGKVKLILKAWG